MATMNCLLVLVIVHVVTISAYEMFRKSIPNGDKVPHPCKPNYLWKGVGHLNALGGGENNKFGLDFKAAKYNWTKVCPKDSDGDGQTNGEELGDPDCVWKVGGVPKTSLGLTHPGVCTPYGSVKCETQNKWVDCTKDEFKCDPLSEIEDLRNVTVNFPQTDVPNTETNYYCMVFDLPSDGDYHMVATIPDIDNEQVMHHILIYGCDETEKEIPNTELNKPKTCGMAAHRQCQTLIAAWAVGSPGACFHKDVGFRIGTKGYKKAAFQFHWNNPEKKSGYRDGSGMTLFYTPNTRVNDAVILMVGQEHLEIPPGREEVVINGLCHKDCSEERLTGPVYVTSAFNHMHYMGRAQRLEHMRNGQKLRDFTNEVDYSYDSPKTFEFKDPIEFRRGDSINITCKFNSMGKSRTTFKGDATSDEMCYGFLVVHPAQNIDAYRPYCGTIRSIPLCKVTSHRQKYPYIDGCKWGEFMNTSHPVTRQLHAEVHSRCQFFGSCLTECKEYIKSLRNNHPCMKGDINALIRQFGKYQSDLGGFFAAVDSCNTELQEDECQCPSTTPCDVTGFNKAKALTVHFALLCFAFVVLRSLF